MLTHDEFIELIKAIIEGPRKARKAAIHRFAFEFNIPLSWIEATDMAGRNDIYLPIEEGWMGRMGGKRGNGRVIMKYHNPIEEAAEYHIHDRLVGTFTGVDAIGAVDRMLKKFGFTVREELV